MKINHLLSSIATKIQSISTSIDGFFDSGNGTVRKTVDQATPARPMSPITAKTINLDNFNATTDNRTTATSPISAGLNDNAPSQSATTAQPNPEEKASQAIGKKIVEINASTKKIVSLMEKYRGVATRVLYVHQQFQSTSETYNNRLKTLSPEQRLQFATALTEQLSNLVELAEFIANTLPHTSATQGGLSFLEGGKIGSPTTDQKVEEVYHKLVQLEQQITPSAPLSKDMPLALRATILSSLPSKR